MIAELTALGVALLLLMGGKKKKAPAGEVFMGEGVQVVPGELTMVIEPTAGSEDVWTRGGYVTASDAEEAARQYAASSGRAFTDAFAVISEDGESWDAVVWFA